MTPRPPTHREPTDEEMQRLPEGTLVLMNGVWKPTRLADAPIYKRHVYAVPITKQEEATLHEPITREALNKALRERDEARAEISAAKQEVLGLVTSIWKKEYQSESPHWQPLPDLQGLISQLDNMYAGMRTQRDQANFDLREARSEKDKLKFLAKSLLEALQETDHHLGYANYPGWVRDEASIAMNNLKLAYPDI